MKKTPKLINLEKKIKKYEEGKLALTIKQVDDLYSEKSREILNIKKTCTHDKAQIYVSHWVDRGYGLDRDYYNYAIRCNDCDEKLADLSSCNGYDNFKSEEAPIKKLVIKYPKWFSDETLSKFNIRRIKHTKETYTYV